MFECTRKETAASPRHLSSLLLLVQCTSTGRSYVLLVGLVVHVVERDISVLHVHVQEVTPTQNQAIVGIYLIYDDASQRLRVDVFTKFWLRTDVQKYLVKGSLYSLS